MKIVVFSDLDATLLDEEDYSWKPAATAIEALRERGGALVMVTSKTLAEAGSLHEELGFDDPFIFENGGGIAFPAGTAGSRLLNLGEPEIKEFQMKGFKVVALGTAYEALVKSLSEISEEVGAPLLGFSAMSPDEVAGATGLPAQRAMKARMRLFDEPFVIPDEPKRLEAEICAAANRRGLEVVKGGRFWHLIGHAGKASAVSMLLKIFRKRYGNVLSIGLGDSPNDFPFLELVDIPVTLGEHLNPVPGRTLPGTTHPHGLRGPQGWNQAVLKILATME